MQLRTLSLVTVLIPGLVTGASAQAEDVVAPDQIVTALRASQCVDEVVTLTAGPSPVPRLDVALVMDVTGSMSEEIAEVRRQASEIVRSVRGLPDTHFAVAILADYP